MQAPTRVRQEHRELPRPTYGSLKDATCWPRWACWKPLKEQLDSAGIRWNLSVTRRLCIDQAPILSTRRRPESVAFVKPVRGCSGVAPSRCSGEPRWPPGGRPASPAPGRHGTGGGALLYGLDRDTYGRDPGRGRGFSRPSTARSPSLPEGHLRGVESRRKGAAKAPRLPSFNAALRPCRAASVRPRPPEAGTRVRGARSEPVHVRPGPRCALPCDKARSGAFRASRSASQCSPTRSRDGARRGAPTQHTPNGEPSIFWPRLCGIRLRFGARSISRGGRQTTAREVEPIVSLGEGNTTSAKIWARSNRVSTAPSTCCEHETVRNAPYQLDLLQTL